ncbi:hypothetical protein D9619_004344 [Psilocybe cf. subviscida]|uniref:Uncharacterized protein n=1 Tax=Psilocybe cf. subviscida TaxID=2480587 RepID=A0A8H5BR70_9AGAR|nr:hypothetical protein D9619_004344 [Psilocybe cf. subviscida]
MDCSLSIVKLKQTRLFLEEFTQRLAESNEKYRELKAEHQRYKTRTVFLEAEVNRLQLALEQSSGLSLVTRKKVEEQDAAIVRLEEVIQQYETQESRHARESADYEDCIEQLETELKYALERNRDGKYHAEENFRLRKTIQRMDAEVDELQTTMKIFSTGESGSSIAAITMGRALGHELMNHMDDERQSKKSSVAQTMTITKGANYANIQKPKIMEVGSLRQGYQIAGVASEDANNVPPHPPRQDLVRSRKMSRQPSLAQTYATVTVTKDSSDLNHSVTNEWITQLQEAAAPANVEPRLPMVAEASTATHDAQLSLVISNVDVHNPWSPLSRPEDECTTSDGSHSEVWQPPPNAYWDARRFVPLDSEERYVFRKVLHERRLKLAPSSSSVAESFNCIYRFSSDRDSLSDAASSH